MIVLTRSLQYTVTIQHMESPPEMSIISIGYASWRVIANKTGYQKIYSN